MFWGQAGKCGLRAGVARVISGGPFRRFKLMEWHIQSRSRACHHTGKSFADGEIYHTVLIETPAGFERMDLSSAAWKELAAEIAARPGVVSHWKGTYETPPAAPPEAIGKDDAESLLRKILARKEDRYSAAAYILAVMLERKRILRIKAQSRESGKRVFLYEHPRSGDLFSIAEPELQLDQLEEVERMVTSLLEHGLPDEETAPASVPVPAPEAAAPMDEPANPPSETAVPDPQAVEAPAPVAEPERPPE